MNNEFASYEKESFVVVRKTKHRVRPRLNNTAGQLKSILDQVPNDAVLTIILGEEETEFANTGELVFEQEFHDS